MKMNSDYKFANFSFLNNLDINPDVKTRLSQLLFTTLKGKTDVLVTPIAKENEPLSILKAFDEVFESKSSKMNSVLLNLEMSNKAKFGPRSIQLPWKDRKQDVIDDFKPDNINRPWLALPKIINAGRLRPLSLYQASEYLRNDTNSGMPYFTRKSEVKSKALEDFNKLMEKKYPCILFTRTQEQSKTRNVWGYPIADTLNEMRYYIPLLNYQRKYAKYRAAIESPQAVSIAMTKLINTSIKLKGEYVLLSNDFIKFDASFKRFMQISTFNYIKALFQRSFWKDIDNIQNRFGTIGLITPDEILYGDHILPSGATITNEMGSLGHYLGVKDFSPEIVDDYIQIQGDDGVYLVKREYFDKLIAHFESIGLSVNVSKAYQSSVYAIYLQNLYHNDYRDSNGIIGGIYPVYRALNRIIYQERWSDFEDYEISGKDYYSIRTITILENCRYHPLFEDLVKFVIKYDKYSLKFSEQGLLNYVKMDKRSSGKESVIQNQLGDDVKGIKSFATYKLIQNLVVQNNLG